MEGRIDVLSGPHVILSFIDALESGLEVLDYTLFLAPDNACTPPNIKAAANGNFLLVNRRRSRQNVNGISRASFARSW